MDNLACIYMDGKKYPCPFIDCETKSEGCFCKRKLDYWQEKEEAMKWQMAKEAFEELRRRIDELYVGWAK